MRSVEVYGASDDLIEVEGDIREEFTHGNDGADYLAFNDGSVLSVEYTADGFWRINRAAEGVAQYEKVEAIDADGAAYSDKVTLTIPDLARWEWVVCGHTLVKAPGLVAS